MSTPTAPLAALMTVFTPPCATSWLLTTSKVPSQFPPFPTGGPSSCNPPRWGSNLAGKGFQYYSPAICPNGFEVGPNCQVIETRTSEGFPPVRDGETAVYCVPSGHTCTTDVTDFRGGVWGFVADATVSDQTTATVGPAIQIRFRQEDLSILETHPLTPGLILAGATTTTTDRAGKSTATTSESELPRVVKGPKTFTLSSTGTSTIPSPQPTAIDTTQNGRTTLTAITMPRSTSLSTSTTRSLNDQPTKEQGLGPSSGNMKMGDGVLTAVILVSCLLGFLAVLFLFLFLSRRCRRNRRQEFEESTSEGFRQVGVGVWVHPSGHVLTLPPEMRQPPLPYIIRDDDGDDNGNDDTVAELGGGRPLGSKENPAELPGSARWSFVSRVSRALSSSRQQTSRARSRAESSMSMATSRRTTIDYSRRFSGNSMSGFEAFAREKWPNGLTVPAVTYKGRRGGGGGGGSNASRSRDRFTMPPPRAPDLRRLSDDGSSIFGLPRLNRISRASDGTFGGDFPRTPISATPVSDERTSDRTNTSR